MVDIPPSKMAAAGALTGEEIAIISQLSTSVTISAATISALASDNSFNDSGSGFIAAGFAVNNYVYVEGFTGNVANNIFSGKITALTAGKMTIGGTDGDVIVDDAAGETVTITKWVSRRKAVSELGGNTGMALISEVITSGSQASVSFAAISSSYRDLVLVVRGRGTNASLTVNVHVQFNNDTGSNYHTEDAHWFSAIGAASQLVSQTSAWVGTLPGASATANYAGSLKAEILAYDDTTFFKNLLSDYGAHLGTGATTQGRGIISGLWLNAGAITEIDVILSAGNFVNGSIVSLYGRM